MDSHLTSIQSYLANMQAPIQMLNARNQANEDYERESWLQFNELEDIEKFTEFWWASSEILKDPVEQKRFALLKSNEERIRFLEGVTGYDRTGTFCGSPWKRQLSGSSGPSSRGSVGSGSGSPGFGGFAQFGGAGFSNIRGTATFGGVGTSNLGGSANFGGDGTSNPAGFSNIGGTANPRGLSHYGGSGSPDHFRRRQGFQVPNSNPQVNASPDPRVVSSEGLAFRSTSSADLFNRFSFSEFNSTIGNNDNDGGN